MSLTPAAWLQTESFVANVDGQDFVFTLTVNPYGEVLEIRNNFLDLPPAAQSLLVGSKTAAIRRKLKQIQSIIPFYVPLATLGYSSGEEWAGIGEKIRLHQQEIPPEELPPFEDLLRDDWVKQLYRLHEKGEKKLLENLSLLIDHKKDNRWVFFRMFNESPCPLAEPVLHCLYPMESDREVRVEIIDGISILKNERSRRFLCKELSRKKNASLYRPLLHGLAGYKHDKIRLQLLKLYQEDRETIVNDYHDYFIRALLPYSGPEVELIMKEALNGPHAYSGLYAFNFFRERGADPDVMAGKLHEQLRRKESAQHVLSALHVLKSLDNEAYLPTSEELVNLFLWNSSAEGSNQLQWQLKEVLRNCVEEIHFTQLEPMLGDPDPEIRIAALDFFEMGQGKEFMQIVKLLEDPDDRVKKRALRNIQEMSHRFRAPQALDPLVRMWEQVGPEFQEDIMSTLASILENAPRKRTLPFLMEHLRHPKPAVRRSIARALAHFQSPEIYPAIQQLLRDNDQYVQEYAQKAMISFQAPERGKEILEDLKALPKDQVLNEFVKLNFADELTKKAVWECFDYVVDLLEADYMDLAATVLARIMKQDYVK
ncbi:HEAT repeat domain-containing protein [Flavilitoribacter nigricans]|uniref:HEAT repeat domain-containing protein n=1 Tax=Flavilitoribacter nigricans (strain ATCC 23147 / DSM 23189 / NBRC 102662 / NCIMB 1420 / SS-2) TaxID=1122177 RepID=A0A2D0N2J3_FLAN2|nr:HEAT repeat domain-containing protein [Flavilitoribacter nigricans]PHN02630.1 hypothetical protein CRP01_31035 [Flavilitoribacter nigricans DSM 23189 = NBRC 102662]